MVLESDTNEEVSVNEEKVNSVNEESGQNEFESDFRKNLPEEYREKYKEFKTAEDFVKGYDNLVRKFGEMTSIPKEDSPREDWDKLFHKLGRPESADDYSLAPKEELKDFLDDNELKEYKLQAYNLGLTDKQAKALFDWNNEKTYALVKEAENEAEREKASALSVLKLRWGAEYQDKLNETADFVKNLTKNDVSEKIYKWQNDPDFIEIMHNMKKKYTGSHNILKNAPASSVSDTDSLRDEATRIRNDPNYKNSARLQSRMREIYKEIASQTDK